MPYSSEEGKDFIKSFFTLDKDIRSVLDVGPGAGTYFDLLQPVLHANYWRAVEIWAPYIEKFGLDKKYDDVVVADASFVDWATLGNYDLIILGDVLEHMGTDDARWVMHKAVQRGIYVVISLPIVHYPQGAEMGNPYEAHVTHWTDQGIRDLLLEEGYTLLDSYQGSVVGVYILKGWAWNGRN